jgi:osmotically-inducible protein OsmY
MAKPSTSEVLRRAQEALASSDIYVLREILVEPVGRSLVLSGCVDSFYHKQLAQEVVRAVVGRCDVINVIEVEVSPALAGGAATTI